ncbi:6-phosphogluconate dehydrogenase C-terminal domain-like protein [Aspergillus filifer]
MSVRPITHPRIHILGLGSIGTFTAHGLKQIPDPPAVTLLLHRESLYDDYLRNKGNITLRTLDGRQISQGGYDVEVYKDDKWQTPSSTSSSSSYKTCDDHINHLIVTVKSTQTVRALRPLKPRLMRSSTILFLQNGCGMVDEVNTHLFPDPASRPNYITGVISHGVTLTSPFHATHTGASSISLGLHQHPTTDERETTLDNPDGNDKHLLQTLLPLSPCLNATSTPYATTHQIQLEKLAVNAFCNPVCAIHNAPNSILLACSGPIATPRRDIMAEISNIVLHLPELSGVPGLRERFAPSRLEETVLGILERTRETVCSMVVDVRGGRETEVSFINGYWVRRGREVGVGVGVNEMLMREILALGLVGEGRAGRG